MIEILKLCVSLLTPILVLIVGLIISKKIEKAKLDVLKEKEWQVKWAEMFLKQATDFNDNITTVICSLFNLQSEADKVKVDELRKLILSSCERLSEIDWNIRNYTQFSKNYQNEVISTQQKLMDSTRQLMSSGQGSLEEVRKQQFEYNNAVRNAHSEILKMK
ncbi:hypothetical protein [Siphonobacter sp. SORGH_AS_1065]|uniref:hypothetical protein n=1 Tax=Siphonobacter sp. SORGH_AS_1065 TaxID=3041795 RepID=UPI0027D7C7BC|nr:hypothetical protein [Siphonobacter sp. SORGH_AS_1065]